MFIVFVVIVAVELVTGVLVVTFQYKSIGGGGIKKVFDCLVSFGHGFQSA